MHSLEMNHYLMALFLQFLNLCFNLSSGVCKQMKTNAHVFVRVSGCLHELAIFRINDGLLKLTEPLVFLFLSVANSSIVNLKLKKKIYSA